MSRYTKLYKTPENLYTENSPVVISAGALLKDNDTNKILVQLKFRNIYDKTIKAVKIEIIPYSVDKEELAERKETQYLDLTAFYNTESGQKQPVFLADNTARSFDIICKSVVFADHSKWENISNAPFISADYPQGIRTKINVTENFSQFIDFATKENIKDNTNIFWQHHDKEKIITQKNELSALLTYTTGELYIKTNELIGNYHSIMSAERKADEDFSEDELKILNSFDELKETLEKTKTEITNDKKQKTKKRIKFSAIIISIFAVIVLTILLITTLIIPSIKYNNAITLLEQKKYQEAINIFTTLEDFKDSSDKIIEANNGIYIEQNKAFFEKTYKEATEFLTNKQYVDAYRKYEKIAIYEDSQEKMDIIIEYANTEIPVAVTNKDYSYALNLLNLPGIDNVDSFKKYISAKRKESISISDAYDLYKELPSNFFDTAERMKIIEKYLPYTGTFHRPNAAYSQPFEFELTLNENDEICYYGIPLQVYTESNEYDYYYESNLQTMYISKNRIYHIWYAQDMSGAKLGPYYSTFTK